MGGQPVTGDTGYRATLAGGRSKQGLRDKEQKYLALYRIGYFLKLFNSAIYSLLC